MSAMTSIEDDIKSALEAKREKADWLASLAEQWDEIAARPRLHPEGEFDATFLNWGNIRNGPTYCYMPLMLRTEEGVIPVSCHASAPTLFLLRECQLPEGLRVKVRHRGLPGHGDALVAFGTLLLPTKEEGEE